jgi:hypothetical protein
MNVKHAAIPKSDIIPAGIGTAPCAKGSIKKFGWIIEKGYSQCALFPRGIYHARTAAHSNLPKSKITL